MNSRDDIPDRPSRFAHPAVTIVASAFGVLFIRLMADRWDSDLLRSLTLGFAMGIPALLIITKWMARRTRDFYAAFYPTLVFSRRQCLSFLYSLPVFAYIFAFFGLAARLDIRTFAGFGMFCVLAVFAYPEQSASRQAAWGELARPRESSADIRSDEAAT